jgi:hypothetical protein
MIKKQNFLSATRIVLLYGFILFTLSCNQKNVITNLSPYYGVWANADCELVQTEKYTLLFERNNDKISVMLRQNEKSGDTIYSKFFSGFIFDSKTKEYEKISSKPAKDLIPIGDYMKLKGGRLEISQTSHPTQLQLVEKIEVCPAYEMPFADSLTIGTCLQYWQLGVFEHNLDPEQLYIEIGTNKHVYIYAILPNILYCRAARIKHNNNGSVFAQNIRLIINGNTEEKTAEMEVDNLKISATDIDIDDLLFKPDVCVFDKYGIYWSFISCDSDRIKLNGCGEVYTFTRQAVDEKVVAEWFKYKPY